MEQFSHVWGYMILFLIIMLGLVQATLLSYELKLYAFSFHDMESNGKSRQIKLYVFSFFLFSPEIPLC